MFPGGEVKCILHIGEGEFEGNMKSFLEDRSLWGKNCASVQFRFQRKKEKKKNPEIKYDQIINSIPTFFNSSIWLSQCML